MKSVRGASSTSHFLNASKVLYGKPVNLNSTFHGLSQCLISSEQMDVAVAVGPPVLAASRLSGRLVPVLNRRRQNIELILGVSPQTPNKFPNPTIALF
jgi:hypothetical protein